ncbi:MAG: hypothetical protein PVI26_11945 [Chitinispirillia bacterium]|jgi:PleD family two-component response regulator
MDFEQNRKAMLEELNKQKRERVIKRKVDSAKQRLGGERQNNVSYTDGAVKKRKKIMIFGKKSYFIRGIVQGLQNSYDVTSFENHEKACDFCINNSISYVFLDMDEPTDWKESTDLFTTTKMMNKNVEMFLMTSDEFSTPVQTLVEKGGIVIKKPISVNELYGYLSL